MSEEKQKKPRKPSLTMSEKFELMSFIKSADQKTPDRVVAAEAASKIGRSVNAQTVTNYRKQFGIAPVQVPTRAQLEARLKELEEKLAA